jgi:hypothetical protein
MADVTNIINSKQSHLEKLLLVSLQLSSLSIIGVIIIIRAKRCGGHVAEESGAGE